MTRSEFDKFKFYMKRSEVIACGVPRKAITLWVASGKLTFIKFDKKGKRFYHKASVAKALGLE